MHACSAYALGDAHARRIESGTQTDRERNVAVDPRSSSEHRFPVPPTVPPPPPPITATWVHKSSTCHAHSPLFAALSDHRTPLPYHVRIHPPPSPPPRIYARSPSYDPFAIGPRRACSLPAFPPATRCRLPFVRWGCSDIWLLLYSAQYETIRKNARARASG